MRTFSSLRSRWTIALVGVLVVACVGAWLAREPLLAWYDVQGLERAAETDRAIWVERTIRSEKTTLPRLIDGLAKSDDRSCSNIQAALAAITAHWPADDARRNDLARRLADRFARLSLAGQRGVLELFVVWLEAATPPVEVVQYAERLLAPAGRSPDKEVRGRSLVLAGAIFPHDDRAAIVATCRESIRKGFQDAEADNRALAARLAVRPQLSLLPQVVPLLDDVSAAVRQAAMLAVGPAPEAITTDDLLRSLHDTDEDVRRLCEAALRRRGLRPQDVTLGRLISDAQPAVRLQVLDQLHRSDELEPAVWLRRLSHDPAPAVRAAAVRAAGEQPQVDLSDRLQQMKQNDPSATVRQLAHYYLGRQNRQLQPSGRP